jgi:hypothetical protein
MAELKDQVFVFTGATFEAAMEAWMREQIAAYPHQEERIRVTALAMRDFLQSDAARRHKLMMRPGRD